MNLESGENIPQEARNFRIDRETPTKESLIPKRLRPSLDEEEFPALSPTEKYIPEHQASELSIKELAGRAIADIELDENTPIPLNAKELAQDIVATRNIEREEAERQPQIIGPKFAAMGRRDRQALLQSERREARLKELRDKIFMELA